MYPEQPNGSINIDICQFLDQPSGRASKAQKRAARRLLRSDKKVNQYKKPLQPRNAAQKAYLDTLKQNDFVIALGPAGTGKTYLTARYALQLLLNGEIQKIVLSRPMVAVSGEQVGFLPGTLKAKVAPWAVPVVDAFYEGASKDIIDRMINEGKIDFVPFQFIRGRTFNDAYVIVDEAQNLTKQQFRVMITRVGQNTKIVLDGDLRQSDLKGKNGLQYAVDIYQQSEVDGQIFEFEDSDVVRSKLCAQWVKAIKDYDDTGR